MEPETKKSSKGKFEVFATKVTRATGSTPAFLAAFLIIIMWALCGPIFEYSETWQLVINTGTTIITFLMVFLIQKAQNKDSMAIQLKLNELVACNEYASNRLVDIEDMTEDEMKVIQKYYVKLSQLTKLDSDLHHSHSLDEARADHQHKKKIKKEKKKHRENFK